MPYRPILASLGYILSADGNCVLMIHRNSRPGDLHLGKYNGLGGKMEAGEDIATCMKREIYEEAALTVTSMQLRGTISWPGFGKHGEDWFGFIFLITSYTGTPPAHNNEGSLEWIPIPQLLTGQVPLWDGDRHFLPMVFDGDPAPFHGIMPYEGGKLVTWNYSR